MATNHQNLTIFTWASKMWLVVDKTLVMDVH